MLPVPAFPPAATFFPPRPSLPAMRDAVQGCRACDLYAHATQGVFGEGARGAGLVLIGEQPGDEEDREGRPFVGPAGRLLDRALEEAGIPREETYVTNAVKHFRWQGTRGKKRLHKPPSQTQIVACRPWLDAELELVAPRAIVCLGASAAKSILGSKFKITESRGKPQPSPLARWVVATFHPSAILRMPDHESREAAFGALVADLRGAHARSAR
ncbi:MAG TPA: UdgX family uracil-DNA binding protein [Candidatus Polarisedimenticolaceae bacterium]|nr:UdgX family uracil-DNA binding protein [Candidatus Polarisedimenticolaceae bacterium]